MFGCSERMTVVVLLWNLPIGGNEMKSVVLCEKPSQARNVQAAIGNKYGRVIGLRGHVLRLSDPDEINPNWKKWGYDLLRPEGGFYPLAEDGADGKDQIIKAVRDALADADRVIIATDCDREGQAIGENLLRYMKFKGEVLRAMFNAEDPVSLREAFENARPNSEHLPLYQAAFARAQVDQIANLSATRAVTLALRPEGMRGALGVGRVRTPTMGIVCKRQREVDNFVPRKYFNIWADIAHGRETVRLQHRPDEKTRLYENQTAQEIADAARAWSGELSVSREAKRQSPPKLPDLPTLQIQASRWGWTAKKTLEMAQALYETHKLTTYPRAENRYLPENEIGNAQAMLDGLKGLSLANISYDEATARTGKPGHFSDKALAGSSHHAIIPNIKTIEQWPQLVSALDADERRLFDYIARSYLAAVGPDREYDRTEFSFSVSDRKFSVVGIIERKAGWREAITDQADDEPGGDDEDHNASLPQWPDKANAIATASGLVEKTTTPPPLYTEGSLIKAMQEAWRFSADPQRAERLKEAKGIGTPATRDSIIAGLFKQGFFETQKGKVIASKLALAVYDELMRACSSWLDPAATAEMEMALDGILRGEVKPLQVIDDILKNTQVLLDAMEARSKQGGLAVSVKQPPSAKLLEAARAKAKRAGVNLPRGATTDARICREFLGPRPEGNAPSEAQVNYARKIAEGAGIEMPAEILTDRQKLSEWIEANKAPPAKPDISAPPSPAQISYAEKIAAAKKSTIPDETIRSKVLLSAWIDANATPAKKAAPKKASSSKKKG